MSFTRIRAWRARMKERKAEQLIALGAINAKDFADAKREAQESLIPTRAFGQPPSKQHAGEEGKPHH